MAVIFWDHWNKLAQVDVEKLKNVYFFGSKNGHISDNSCQINLEEIDVS